MGTHKRWMKSQALIEVITQSIYSCRLFFLLCNCGGMNYCHEIMQKMLQQRAVGGIPAALYDAKKNLWKN